MQDARVLLDSLMGPSRDKSAEEQQKEDGWKDKNVCKRFLVGFCPNNVQDNWFHNTRRKDINVCNKVHSERLQSDFEKHPDRERYQAEYEKEFLDFLEGLVREADAWIARESGNCTGPGRITKMPNGVRQKMFDMQERSEQMMKQAEDLADAGNVAASKHAVEIATNLKEEAKEIKAKHTFDSIGEKVCEICGVRCNPDEPADFKAHLDGRLHEGYTKIRSRVKELREKMRSRSTRDSSKEESKSQASEKDKDRRDRGRDRDRERDRNRDRDRDRNSGRKDDRDRCRERKRSRSRSRRARR